MKNMASFPALSLKWNLVVTVDKSVAIVNIITSSGKLNVNIFLVKNHNYRILLVYLINKVYGYYPFIAFCFKYCCRHKNVIAMIEVIFLITNNNFKYEYYQI